MNDLKLKITPCGSNVLIRTMRRKGKMLTKGGLEIPEEHTRKYQMSLCMVVAVGRGRPLANGGRAPMSCKPGDVVLIRAEPMHIPDEVDGELLALADDSTIAGVITEGLDLEDYQIGITLFEEYANVQAAQAEADARAGGNIVQPH